MKQTDGLCVCANDRTGLRANIPRSLHAAVHVRALTCLQAFPSFIDMETQAGPYLRGGLRDQPIPPKC